MKRTFAILAAAVLLLCSCNRETVRYEDQRIVRSYTGITALEIGQRGFDVELAPAESDTLSVDIRIDLMVVTGIDPAQMETPVLLEQTGETLAIGDTYARQTKTSRGLISVKVPASVRQIGVNTREGNIRAAGLHGDDLRFASQRGTVDAADCRATRQMSVSSAK